MDSIEEGLDETRSPFDKLRPFDRLRANGP
jgi:hypothetical protein